MLFDLRSRGRRQAVRVIYLGLALLMLGGLVLFGVGAGNGFGGLLNAFTNNGSGNSSGQIKDQAQKRALKATKANPSSPGAWAQLIQADFELAGQGGNYDSATASYSATGKKVLADVAGAWERYTALTKSPDPNIAILAARAYTQTGQYAGAAQAWQDVSLAQPKEPKGYECWAVNAYAAQQTRTAELAGAKALSLVPKAERLTLKQLLEEAKSSPSVAKSVC
jgi:hypothetical protein